MPALPSVLIIDDDADLVRFTTRYLKRFPLTVESCPDLDRAFALIGTSHYSLAVLDVSLAENRIVEFIGRFREESPAIRFLLWSGYPISPRSLGLPSDAGVRFLQKPFTPDDLVRAMQELLGPGIRLEP